MTTVQDITSKAMTELKKKDLEEFHEGFEERTDELMKIMNEAAEKEVEMEKIFMMKDLSGIEKEITKIIGPERVQIIKDAFLAETFTMTLEKMADDRLQIALTKDGKQYKESVVLSRIDSGEWYSMFQAFSIIVEGTMLMLNIVGIGATIDERSMDKLYVELEPVLKGNAVQEAVKAFMKAWNQEGATVWKRARALFCLIKDSYAAGIFWKIIKMCISHMGFWQKAKAIAEITVTLVAAFATDGVALVARIVLALADAASFIKKVCNLQNLTAREQSLVSA